MCFLHNKYIIFTILNLSIFKQSQLFFIQNNLQKILIHLLVFTWKNLETNFQRLFNSKQKFTILNQCLFISCVFQSANYNLCLIQDQRLKLKNQDQLRTILSKILQQIDQYEQLLKKQAEKRNKKIITKKDSLKRTYEEISKFKFQIFTLMITCLVPLFSTIVAVSNRGPNKIIYDSSNSIKQKQIFQISGRQYIAFGFSALILIIIVAGGWGCCCSCGHFTQQLKRLEFQKQRLETQIENLENE